MIDINTKFITLVGTPLGQSFAARMQNAAYRAMGGNMAYFYTEADSEHLKEIIEGIRYMPSFAGCAVTKPNKVKVLQYLDNLDPLCAKMGACNTVVKEDDGLLTGYNTDGAGFFLSITKEGGITVEGGSFFCFGAGGAGRAICSTLAHHGAAHIFVTDISAEAGNSLAEDINKNFAPVAAYVAPGDYAPMANCQVILNATGIGMGRSIGQTPLPKEQIDPSKLYFDACYNPQETAFLINAREAGARTLNGLGMSLYQGAVQIRLWTGEDPPVNVMRRELLDIIDEINAGKRFKR